MTQRTRSFLLFFSIVLSLYTLLNAYVLWHAWSLVAEEYHGAFAVIFGLVAYAFILGRILERFMLNRATTGLVLIGAYWLGAMVYFVLLFFALDLGRLLVQFLPLSMPWAFPGSGNDPGRMVAIGVILLLVTAGAVNARHIRIKALNLEVDKQSHGMPSLTFAVASDIHLGTIISRKRIQRIVDRINALDADVVLLPGDVVDEDLAPVIKQNLGEILRSIRSRYGVFAVTGNHEYIGGVEPAVRYLREHGITVLRDEVVTIADRIHLVGREDFTAARFGGGKRKLLREILRGVDTSLPIILMDHQPFRLHEAEEAGVDLQLSGHTHNGQLWPFNYITKRVYELSWGYKQRGKTHYYVSSGIGTWGPPLKLGNHAEIVHVTLSLSGKDPLKQAQQH